MGKYKTRRKLHKRHKRKIVGTKKRKMVEPKKRKIVGTKKRKTFIKIKYKKIGGAAADEGSSATEELYIANPFEKPQPDDNGRVSLYKWDYPQSGFVKWNKENNLTPTKFIPFGEPTYNECHINSYNEDKTKCWVKWGPNSLFFTTKQDFEKELKYRYSEFKKNKGPDQPSIEELRRIKNSMLGYQSDDVQDLVEISASAENIVAPCINEQCEPCPERGTKAIECQGADHLKHVADAQGDLPFGGLGYTIDLEERGDSTKKPSYVGAPEFIIPQSTHVIVVPVAVYNGDETLREFYAAAP